jgi:hypothetical protein
MLGPKKFPTSRSSPQLNLSDDEIHELIDTKLRLSGPESSFLPYFSSQESSGIRIKSDYLANEAMAEWSLEEKNYLTSENRKLYEITSIDGMFQDYYGKALHGVYLYVLFPNDILYACQIGRQRFHSYLSSGLNVKGAGLLYCEYGMLITVSNESGHYKPTHLEMRPALSTLLKRTAYPFVFEDHSTLDPSKPFQDVKFFHVNNSAIELPLTAISTMDELKSLILPATSQAEVFLKARYLKSDDNKLLVTDDSDGDCNSYPCLSSYYIDEHEERVATSSSSCQVDPVLEQLKDDPNAFMKHTCLARILGKRTQSRFFGNKKANI